MVIHCSIPPRVTNAASSMPFAEVMANCCALRLRKKEHSSSNLRYSASSAFDPAAVCACRPGATAAPHASAAAKSAMNSRLRTSIAMLLWNGSLTHRAMLKWEVGSESVWILDSLCHETKNPNWLTAAKSAHTCKQL